MSFPKLSWGREKHDLADRWPKGPDGTPEKPAFLADSTEEDNAAGMTVEMLRAYGIPVMKKYDDKDGTLGKVLFGTPSGGVGLDRKSTRLNSSHKVQSRMPSSA